MLKITAIQLKEAMIEAGISFVPIRPCSICEEIMGFVRRSDMLFIDSSCGCASSQPRRVPWLCAEEFVNEQKDNDAIRAAAARFGLTDIPEPIKCPQCGSNSVSGRYAAFWAPLDANGEDPADFHSHASSAELTDDRHCGACDHSWSLDDEVSDVPVPV